MINYEKNKYLLFGIVILIIIFNYQVCNIWLHLKQKSRECK